MKFIREDNGLVLWVTTIPDRKKPVLLIGHDSGTYELVATFRSEEAAGTFQTLMTMFLKGTVGNGKNRTD